MSGVTTSQPRLCPFAPYNAGGRWQPTGTALTPCRTAKALVAGGFAAPVGGSYCFCTGAAGREFQR